MLQKRSENPHATLITLFMNVNMQLQAGGFPVDGDRDMRRAMKYLGLKVGDLISSSEDPKLIMLNDVTSSICDADYWFER